MDYLFITSCYLLYCVSASIDFPRETLKSPCIVVRLRFRVWYRFLFFVAIVIGVTGDKWFFVWNDES